MWFSKKITYRSLGLALVAGLFCFSAQGSIFPENDLHQEDSFLNSNIDEELFRQLIKEAVDVYEPIVKAHGGILKAYTNWKSSKVNAAAMQDVPVWGIYFFGGLARRPEITPDSFTMVICHEIGHHIGGYPLLTGKYTSWYANEGQSDYFASHSCLKKLWKDQKDENSKYRELVDEKPKRLCDWNWQTQEQRDLCYRTSVAAKGVASLLAVIRKTELPSFETPDQSKREKMLDSHPSAQCRLDTFVAGSLCSKSWVDEMIPGLFHKSGQRSQAAEFEANQVNCNRKEGYVFAPRPLCWFKPATKKQPNRWPF